MNLNKSHKNDIVRAIMADIPEFSYRKMIRDYVQDEALKLMPAAVLALYNDEGLRPFVATVNVYGRYEASCGDCGRVFWMTTNPENHRTLYATNKYNRDHLDHLTQTLLKNVQDRVVNLCDAAAKQQKDRESMREKLKSMLLPIRTLKQAKTLLEADLHKYLPPEPPKADKSTAMGTAVVPYVVGDLKSMGWPKEQAA